jgi:iron complex outermembrane receptor protein
MDRRKRSKGLETVAACGLWLAFAAAPAAHAQDPDAPTPPPPPPGTPTEPTNPDTKAAEQIEQTRPAPRAPDVPTLPDVQVTATRAKAPRRSTPAAISVLGQGALRDVRRGVALADKLATVPGVLARQRNNYAQDEQLTIRGFGARATFGIRGVRLYQDGIPATMPDGQGQVSHFALAGAERIEVLRGPLASLYGNAAGGVVQVFTGDGRDAPGPALDTRIGSDGFRRLVATWGGGWGDDKRNDYRVDVSRFRTDGYRDHSAATREGLNAKVEFGLPQGRLLRLLVNGLSSPDVQDPLGLTAVQMDADPRQATAAALVFNTRKTVRQAQVGGLLEWPTANDDFLRVRLWGGQRRVEQYLAVPVAAQANPLSGGGVVDLHSPYAGVDISWEHHSIAFGDPFDLVVGIDRERQRQHRRGYENFDGALLGVRGALRRDETDTVGNEDHYVQLGWRPHPDWYLYGGLRRTWVRFRSRDHFVTAANPDDGGDRDVHADNPVFGANWHFRPQLHAYFAVGDGFETPTFDELGYRPDGISGLNLDLEPARSRTVETGLKWDDDAGDRHAELALFHAQTRDELAVASNSGGRSTYRNAGRAWRQGIELSSDLPLPGGRLRVAATWLDATYRDGFLTCASSPCSAPTVQVPPGTRIPGLPRERLTLQARWGGDTGWTAGVEAQAVGRVPVANTNDERAAGYGVVDASVGYGFQGGALAGRAFLAVENAFDRRYAGSVIVNESNGRYYEPASGRTWLVGLELHHRPR